VRQYFGPVVGVEGGFVAPASPRLISAGTTSGESTLPQPGLVSSESRRQYGIALYDADGDVIEGAQYVHASDEPPTPGLRIDLPQGTWFVHEVATGLFRTVVTGRP
jgi:hypothetical protein